MQEIKRCRQTYENDKEKIALRVINTAEKTKIHCCNKDDIGILELIAIKKT